MRDRALCRNVRNDILCLCVLLLGIVEACSKESSSATPANPRGTQTSVVVSQSSATTTVRARSRSTRGVTMNITSPTACPVTRPNGSTPPGEKSNPNYYGNGQLWTALWPDGVVRVTPRHVTKDGRLEMKFPWWRGSKVVGRLTISGYKVGRANSGPSLRASIPSGYGNVGFQASTLIFQSEGCWKVQAKAGSSQLSFITFVQKANRQGYGAALPPG